jgi:UDP-N-acetylmuramyl tripeptide synthase
MNFKQAITISGKIYNLLSKINLDDYFKIDGIIDNYYPQIISRLQNYSDIAKVAICSTNGKKTITSFLNTIIESNNQTTITNITENFQKKSILTSIILELSKSEEVRNYYTMAFEDYELESYFNSMKFDYLLLNNIFYDHKDNINCREKRRYIQNAIMLNSKLNLILNADDVYLYDIDNIKNDTLLNKKRNKVFYGFREVRFYNNSDKFAQRNDVIKCPNCGCDLWFNKRFYSHLGHFECECGFKRPQPDVVADVTIFPDYSFLNVYYKNEKYAFKMPLGGLYNAYDALGAIALALEVNIPRKIISQAIENITPIKAHDEIINCKGKNIKIKVVNNSTSLSENLRELYYEKNYKIVFCLNDSLEDGLDTSWIWDANFGALEGFENRIYVSSNRFDDMALRLKYANVNPTLIVMDQSVSHAIECCFWDLDEDENMMIITTNSLVDDIYRIIKKYLQ